MFGKNKYENNDPILFTGPVQVTRRLVSIDDKVYATLGLTAPVSKIDAGTGKTLLTYKNTEFTEEFIVDENKLITVPLPYCTYSLLVIKKN